MKNLVRDLWVANETSTTRKITTEQFNEFRKHFTLNALRGLKYGQAFCNYFDITDYILMSSDKFSTSEDHINKIYLRKKFKAKRSFINEI